jgi:hypothetical protein
MFFLLRLGFAVFLLVVLVSMVALRQIGSYSHQSTLSL